VLRSFAPALGTAAFVYFQTGNDRPLARTVGILLSALAVASGVLIMSVLGRLRGKEIDYASEKDAHRLFLFKIVSRILVFRLIALLVCVAIPGRISLHGV
jgi:hypothetical protein